MAMPVCAKSQCDLVLTFYWDEVILIMTELYLENGKAYEADTFTLQFYSKICIWVGKVWSGLRSCGNWAKL